MTKTTAFTLSVTLALNVATSPIASGSGTGNTYYVATNGSDSNSGNFDRPFRTIKQGLSALTGGDTLLIRGGTYNEGISITEGTNSSVSGAAANNRTWIGAYSGETVTLTGGSNAVLELRSGVVKYITFDNLRFNAGGDGAFRYGASITADGSTRTVANHIRIQNSEFYNADSCKTGIYMGGYESGPDGNFSYNEFFNVNSHDNGTKLCTASLPASLSAHGWYIMSSGNLFDGIQAYNNGQTGMQIYSGTEMPRNNIVRNSYFHNNGVASGVGGGGLDVFNSDNQIYNNIFANERVGVTIGRHGGNNNLFYNNTVYNNWGGGLIIDPGGSGHVVKNNIIYGGQQITNLGASVTYGNNLCGSPGEGCDIVGNPLFVDAANGDFRLQSPGSPAINGGTSFIASGITVSTLDIGAY